MRRRCSNPKDKHYHLYGGRGITVCERWEKDFDAFVVDMGPRPEKYSIERLDNNLGYDPFNCIWATMKTQQRNRRNNILIPHDGALKTAGQIVEELLEPWEEQYLATKQRGYFNLRDRLRQGMTPEQALIPKQIKEPKIPTPPMQPVHGSKGMFKKHKCRCSLCVAAAKIRYKREYINQSEETRKRKRKNQKIYQAKKRNPS